MNATRLSIALLLAAAGAAHAQAPLSRAQVRAELAEAARTGALLAPGDSGMTLAERDPSRYPRPGAAPGETRAQVRADLQSAIRHGDVLAGGDSGRRENERFPQRYPDGAPHAVARTRAEVRAETADAIRRGDVLAIGDSGQKLNERFPRQYAAPRRVAAAR